MKNNFQSNGKGRNQRVWQLLISMLFILTMGIGQMWGADPTHASPAIVKVANRNFLDLTSTPSNVTVSTDSYSNYGPGYFISNKSADLSASWWAFTGTFKSTSGGYTIHKDAVGFHSVGSSTSDEFYQILQLREGSGRMTQMDFYVTGTTQIGFQWKNGSTNAAKYLSISIYEMNVSGATATDGATPVSTLEGTKTSDADQYAASAALSGSKYYHIVVTVAGESNCNLYGLTFKHAPVSSCAAGAPGNISKGELTSGSITLTAAGSAASGDTWYWQDAADGTATNKGTGATKSVNVAGTYYIRSYNTAGECWSAAKSVTVVAADFLATPTVTFNDGNYVVGDAALNLSGLWSSNSDGAVTYALKEASDDAEVSGTSFSATKAGSYVVTASQAATATYNAVEKEATITVTVNPLGTHTLTWTMKVGGSSSTSNLVNSVNSTSTYVTISNTPNIGSSSSVENATPKSDRTVKVLGDYIGTARGENSYIEFPFSIADGYTFTPTSASIKVANVDNTRSYDVVIMNASGSESGETTFASTKTDGSVETISWNSISGLTLEGNCKMRVYAYLASGTTTHRFGTPLTITGTVAAKPVATAPSISAPTADSEAEYDLGSTITALEVTATGYPAPAYQWYKNDTKTTEGATAIDGAESANYTPANNEASDFYYYCVATNASGSATSHFFHVTVNSCTPPTAPASLGVDDGTLTYNSATLSWDGKSAGANGYVIALTSEAEGATGTFDWKDESTAMYVATGLKQETEYTFKVKYKGTGSQCEYSEEVTKTFTTTVPTVADLVTIDADYTFTPSAALIKNTLYEGGKIISLGDGNGYNSNGLQIKRNRPIAFKVANNARVKITFTENGTKTMELGDALTTEKYATYASSATSPMSYTFTTGGVVYLTANDQLYMKKLEVIYPRTVTYDLNGGTGTQPTESAHYEGDKFTVHNGETGITAPSGQEFDKWKDQDNADVAGGAEYTMPAKAVTLTAQWRAETVKYTVTYDLADYTAGVAPTETNKAAGDVFAIKTAPSRDGYAFMGWLCDIDAQTYQATDDYTMTAAATTFTAVWKQEFQVTYNLQGHGDPIAAQVVLDGGKVTKPADPFVILYEFGGWYKEAACTNAWDFDNDVVTANTELFAKWTEFNGCAYLIPAAAGDALHVGDNVALNTASFGGTLKVANMKTEESTIQYNGYGLYFGGGGKDSLRVTINNQMQVGTKITVALRAGTNGTSGLKLMTLGGTEKAALGWTSATNGDEGTFSYTVTAGDGLEGTKAFRLQRNGSVYLKYVSVENCAPQDFTVTYKDGESTTLGTEDVIENEHPTATGIATKKQGYVFQGWAETNGGSVVDLNDIVITADKTLYAVYTVRVCATSGSMFKFQMKTDLVNGNVFASAPNSIAATTTNYLAELAGGEVTFSVTGGNNRLQFNDQKAISFANSAGGQITINLDCPLAEGDEVRFINYASNGNSANLSDGTHNQILNGNNSETVQTWSVPATWAGKYELTLTRGGNTAKITYFEIYRRPAVTGVSVADLTVREGASTTPVMTLAPSDDALITSQAWSILSGDDKITINPTTGEVTGVAEGDAEIKVVLNGDPTISATATVHVVETFVQQDVTESIVWDFSKAGVVTSQFSEQVLANVDGVTLDASQFDARKLVGSAQNITATYFQGTMITFNATVAGKLSVRFTNGNSNVRNLKVYVGNPEVEIASWSYSNAATENKSIDVPAGKVTLRSYQGDAPNNVRIMNLEFLAAAHQRTSGYNAGDLGTVCLEDETFIEGANLYELAGLNENGYLAFDEVLSGELEAGKPYLFEVTNPSLISFYKPVGAAHTDTEVTTGTKGMIGTFAGTTLYQGSENLYYFSGRHIWKVNDFTVAIPIPAHRCYVDYDAVQAAGPAQAPAAGRRRVTLGVQGTQVTTDINNVGSDDVQCTKVMIDGQLYILRGEKMYDATGRLVK